MSRMGGVSPAGSKPSQDDECGARESQDCSSSGHDADEDQRRCHESITAQQTVDVDGNDAGCRHGKQHRNGLRVASDRLDGKTENTSD